MMGVYIKGMEMTKTCGSCRFHYFREDECSWYSCSLLPRDIDQGSSGGFRQPDCPMNEIPEPHGRLIDADALVEMAYKEETDGVTFCVDSAEELEILFDDNAPTVIGAEGDDYDYERASDMRDYCKMYEPTYNPEDGRM